MKHQDIMRMCLQNLLRRKSRTLLTLLGVLIGCCSIVIMVSIGMGTAESQKKMLAKMGDLTIITVTPKNSGTKKEKLTDKTLKSLKAMDNVVAVTPKISLDDYDVTVKLFAGINDRYVADWSSVAGIDTNELEKMGYQQISGSGITRSGEMLAGEFVAYNFADTFRPEGSNMVDRWSGGFDDQGNPINVPDPYFDAGKTPITVQIEANNKTIRRELQPKGILKEDNAKGGETSYGLVMGIGDLRDMMEQLQEPGKRDAGYKTVLVKVSDIAKVTEVEKQIRQMNFSTSSMESIREPMEREARQKQMMLGGLGGISLFVAALGITNTMIMSISERTREIGIMKSLGCYVRDIRILFLSEAGAIGLLGGIVGSIISMIIAVVINLISFGMPPTPEYLLAAIAGSESVTRVCVVPPWLLLSAIVFSVGIGLGSGYYPANKAVQISALEAIKSN